MIIFNSLPPAPLNMPSAGLSILSAYLKDNDIDTKTVYWNLLLHRILEDELKLPGNSVFPLMIHTLGLLRGNPNPESAAYLQRSFPDGYTSPEKTCEAAEFILEYMKNRIGRLLTESDDEKLYICFQTKHDQWVSSLVFSSILREVSRAALPRNKQPVILAGGFARREAAESYLKIDPNTNFCFWGEGEESLLSFIENRGSGEPVISPLKPRERDFRERIFPDHSDYFKAVKETGIPAKDQIQIPVEGIRGCHWNRCRFCIATRGMRHSERSPESMAVEIAMQNRLYGIGSFYFTDDDTTGGSEDRINSLCKHLVRIHRESGGEIGYTAWINPGGMRLDYYRKLKDAGFTCLKTGHEADNDSLLEKMDKRSRFADNILFLKAAALFGIEHQGGIPIITGIPGESEGDLNESIGNLRFLRFFLNPKTYHGYNQFDLGKGSRFYREMDADERKNYNINLLGELLPEGLLGDMNEDFLQYKREQLVNASLWQDFKNRERAIRGAGFSYSFSEDETPGLLFREHSKTGGEVNEIRLSPKELDILRASEERIVSLNEIVESQENSEAALTRRLALGLKDKGLLYISEDEGQCVSVIILPARQNSAEGPTRSGLDS